MPSFGAAANRRSAPNPFGGAGAGGPSEGKDVISLAQATLVHATCFQCSLMSAAPSIPLRSAASHISPFTTALHPLPHRHLQLVSHASAGSFPLTTLLEAAPRAGLVALQAGP